jgi:hypothetical protein
MIDLEKIPTWLKAMVGVGLLLMGPLMVLSFWFGGTTGGITAVLTIIVYFTVVYIVGIRRYVGPQG